MRNLIVVDDPNRWPLDVAGAEVVASRAYLTDRSFAEASNARVFNLCRSYRYQRTGYYVSLLAEARGHRPLPNVRTVQDLKSPTLLRMASDELDELMQRSLRPLAADAFTLDVYFGKDPGGEQDRLARALYQQFPAPLLQARFARDPKDGSWSLRSLNPLAGEAVAPERRPQVAEAARAWFDNRPRLPKRPEARYDLAILVNPEEKEPPSNPVAIRRFVEAGRAVGFEVEVIGPGDFGRVGEFDALFLRETTSVAHRTYRFACRAAAERMVVIDDPESILRCTNKVYLAELLERARIPAPRTRIVDRHNAAAALAELGLPCVLKQPDSAFSAGVVKADTEEQYRRDVDRLLKGSDLIVAQEFQPTDYDWRVGVFEGEPLYVCQYFMARRHWQVIKRDAQGQEADSGRTRTLPVEEAPKKVVETAVRAAHRIGRGLYGVDLKQVGDQVVVIEVNDNPSIDAGCEDVVLGAELYRRIMAGFLRRVEAMKSGGG